ncbi:L,D-transpeptidase [Streptomyces sp. NPDC004609]|uniref:L,D-transpeptidase n=1 Tax=Streptomyces sp. NPDC004609 TaxID=3364704 RepID=UPI0036B752CF
MPQTRSISARRLPRPAAVAALLGVTALCPVLVASGAGPAGAATRPPATTTAARAEACSPDTGPYQSAAERHLGLPRDGTQSAADCTAIQTLQAAHGLDPANGYSGVETWRIIQYEQALAAPGSLTGCPYDGELVVCIDLTRQLLWVWDGNQVAFGPVPIRTGKAGYATRTGHHRIYDRVIDQWSDLYEGPMPFSQFFNGGQALHASYRNIWEEPGSHGCVNLRYEDAKRLWRALRFDDLVYVWGRRGD